MLKGKELKQGEKFGLWTVLGKYKSYPRPSYLCKCFCGKIKRVQKSYLISGRSTKCGSCGGKMKPKKHGFTSHGSVTRFYQTYHDIKQRCINKKATRYNCYGGRGIKCERDSFEKFKDDMYESYLEHIKEYGEHQTTIDRIDVNGNYCKENCRWATYQEQGNNKTCSRYYNYEGEKLTARQIAKKLGTTYYRVYYRLGRHNGTIEELKKDLERDIKKHFKFYSKTNGDKNSKGGA